MGRTAYDIDKIVDQTLLVIAKERLFFIEDIIPYLPCSRSWFFEKNLDKLDSIKEALIKNKVELKVSMRAKWYKSNAPALQLALMKLISSDHERKALSTSYMETKQEHTRPDFDEFSSDDIIEMLKKDEQQDGQT
jgi:hypothetical protein